MISIARQVQVFHGRRFFVEPAWRERLARIGIADGQDWAALSKGQLISASGTTTQCYRIALDDGQVIYFKRYVYPLKRLYEFWLRPGKAAVETWAYARLKDLGIPTLDVVAFGERRVFGMLWSTFVATKAVEESMDLSQFATDVWWQLPKPEKQNIYRDISGQLVEQLRRAHLGHFFHHDLKWRNILVCQQGGRYVPVWIDAPRASRMWLRARRGVMVDLSGLARYALSLLSTYDCMRFLCRYLGVERRPGDAKRLYLEVAAHLARRPPRPIKLPAV